MASAPPGPLGGPGPVSRPRAGRISFAAGLTIAKPLRRQREYASGRISGIAIHYGPFILATQTRALRIDAAAVGRM